MWSSCGAIASNARAIRSSLSASGGIPKTSPTAQDCAQDCTCSIGAGEVSRLAMSASITCPCVKVATSRTGHAASTLSRIPSRRQKAATGNAPSIFSTLGAPYTARP
jgi:hypothetical protein